MLSDGNYTKDIPPTSTNSGGFLNHCFGYRGKCQTPHVLASDIIVKELFSVADTSWEPGSCRPEPGPCGLESGPHGLTVPGSAEPTAEAWVGTMEGTWR